MSKYIIKGIEEPGTINAKVDGRFIHVHLHEASDEVLAKLYDAKCPFVELTPEEFLNRNPQIKDIKIKPISIKKTAPSS